MGEWEDGRMGEWENRRMVNAIMYMTGNVEWGTGNGELQNTKKGLTNETLGCFKPVAI